MHTRHGVHFDHFKAYTTDQARDEFLAKGLFKEGEINLIFSYYDRFVFRLSLLLGVSTVARVPVPIGLCGGMAEENQAFSDLDDAPLTIVRL